MILTYLDGLDADILVYVLMPFRAFDDSDPVIICIDSIDNSGLNALPGIR